ncbi:MAG: hypothetical protein KatS3mg124_1785 [Porticoccaceae bacterium]|nr:MAG: hypothetical protein KatS3mg124_1785 [Porticoccaceae bacterium]
MALGIEALSVYCLPPPRFLELAARLGAAHISTGLSGADFGQPDYRPWSLREDRALLADTRAALAATGVAIALGEGFALRPASDPAAWAQDLDLFAELGVPRINTVVFDPERNRARDRLGSLAEAAAARGLAVTLELPPTSVVGSLEAGLALLEELACPNLSLLLDTMHFARGGGDPQTLRAVAGRIGYVQLADSRRAPVGEDYLEEALYQRLPPGAGELPLAEILAALPATLPVSLEVPSRSWFGEAGGVEDWLAGALAAARRLLSSR